MHKVGYIETYYRLPGFHIARLRQWPEAYDTESKRVLFMCSGMKSPSGQQM